MKKRALSPVSLARELSLRDRQMRLLDGVHAVPPHPAFKFDSEAAKQFAWAVAIVVVTALLLVEIWST